MYLKTYQTLEWIPGINQIVIDLLIKTHLQKSWEVYVNIKPGESVTYYLLFFLATNN